MQSVRIGQTPKVLIVDDDREALGYFETVLRQSDYDVTTACSGSQGLDVLSRQHIDVALLDLMLPEVDGIEVLQRCRARGNTAKVVVITGSDRMTDAIASFRAGAIDVLRKPVFEDQLLEAVAHALNVALRDRRSAVVQNEFPSEAHAAGRWAQALVRVIDSPKDPRTVALWGRWIAASPGALKNWCRTAGISPRRSLVFARILRAVIRSEGGRHTPENLLDVVDCRTLAGLLKFAGFKGRTDFPRGVQDFWDRQVLIRDTDALEEIRKAMHAISSRCCELTGIGRKTSGHDDRVEQAL